MPDYFGFFGGHAEGEENSEETLRREIKEELDFILGKFSHFKQYEFEHNIKDVFTFKVEYDFENKIKILEGQYGKWFSEKKIISEQKLIEDDKLVLNDFFEKIYDRK